MQTEAWSATTSSSEIVPATEYRDEVYIQNYGPESVNLGIGEAAVLTKGARLGSLDAIVLRGEDAEAAISAITSTGTSTGTWHR